MKRLFIVLFLLIFCCGCAADETPAIPLETQPPQIIETETVTFSNRRTVEFESVYDNTGHLTEEIQTQLDETGRLAATVVTRYGDDGLIAAYFEKHYGPDGELIGSLVKAYEGGLLTQQEQVIFWENQNPRYVNRCSFTPEGTVLEELIWEYAGDGVLVTEKSDRLISSSGLRSLQQQTFHPDGTAAYICQGIFHPATYELLDGTVETFSETGALLSREEAHWEEAQRTSTGSFTQYDDAGGTAFFYETSAQYDSKFNRTVYKHTAYEAGTVFAHRFVEACTYDDAGLLQHKALLYYLQDGTPSEQYICDYRYDDRGNAVYIQNIHKLTPGVQQNRTVTEYTYGGQGNLLQETQTGFDVQDQQKFQTVKDYDDLGTLTTFTTVSNLGNRYICRYTYDENGLVIKELMETHYRSGTRTDYQETAWEYHENGKHKTVTVHKWTSHDEAKYPDTDPASLGKTTVTEYDEEGNKL